MRLAVLGFLAALVALPLAAEAAETPTRWAVTLSGRVVETYNYGTANRTPECIVQRFGKTTREWRVVSTRPTVVSVERWSSHARYRPGQLFRVRITRSAGKGSWTEMRQCLGEEILTDSGTCSEVATGTPGPRSDGPARTASPSVVGPASLHSDCAASTAPSPLRFVAERCARTGGRGSAACGQPSPCCRAG